MLNDLILWYALETLYLWIYQCQRQPSSKWLTPQSTIYVWNVLNLMVSLLVGLCLNHYSLFLDVILFKLLTLKRFSINATIKHNNAASFINLSTNVSSIKTNCVFGKINPSRLTCAHDFHNPWYSTNPD